MSHRRYNPLIDEWIIVAPGRIKRPWNGEGEDIPSVDASDLSRNPLAPGGIRSNGKITPNYLGTYVFNNDFPSFTDCNDERNDESDKRIEDCLYRSQSIKGICKVVCYDPRSNMCMSRMNIKDIEGVIDTWIDEISKMESKYEWIQIFENRGTMVGCSNAHPHGQIWCSNYLPNIPAKKYATQKAYYERTGRPMLMDIVKCELEFGKRIVVENEEWIVFVPYWACWPYETMVLPKRHISSLNMINENQKKELAKILKILLTKYDNLFKCPFPFSMGWLSAPTGCYMKEDHSFWTLHGVYLPPLLRSATVKKFMAGYELLCEPQRDQLPENAASSLRLQSDKHYADD